MANLTLCRLVRGVSGLSRFVTKNYRLSSSCSSGLTAGMEPVTLRTADIQLAVGVPSRSISRWSSEVVLSQLPAAPGIHHRSMSSTDHVRLWQIERVVSAAFIVLLPGMVILENPIVDGLFGILVVMHAHWGLEAVVLDYVRPSVVGTVLPKVAFLALYLFSAVTLVGLLALIYSGPGIGKTAKNFWSIGSNPPAHGA